MLKLKKIRKSLINRFGKPNLINYRGYGNAESVYMSGRLVKSYGLKITGEEVKRYWNILAMLERYLTPGISGVELEVHFNGERIKTITDYRGFFEVCFHKVEFRNIQKNWFKGYVKFLTEIHSSVNTDENFYTEVLIPSSKSTYGVISDIDDTFLISYSTNFLLKIKQLLWKNAFTRKAFSGASTFYKALSDGFYKEGENPFFYVSSSDWNLYDLLTDFCHHNNIPKGVFFLNDFRKRDSFKLRFWKGGLLKHGHKKDKIETIFETYPDLKFILLGDSGQKDAEIYKEISEKYSNRILAIYIRDIGSDTRKEKVLTIAETLKNKYGITMLLMEHSDKGAKHALGQNFVSYKNVESLVST